MKKICIPVLILTFFSFNAHADCSWFNAYDNACWQDFEKRVAELDADFPKVKKSSPFYKIYKLTINKDDTICKAFLQDLERFRTPDNPLHFKYDKLKFGPTLANLLDNNHPFKDKEGETIGRIYFTKLAENSYWASLSMDFLDSRYRYKLTTKAEKMPTDDFVNLPLGDNESDETNYEIFFNFYQNTETQNYYVTSFKNDYVFSTNNYINPFLYELSTTDNQIVPICELENTAKDAFPDMSAQFPELMRLYKMIAGDKHCGIGYQRIYTIDEHILNRAFFLITNHNDYHRNRDWRDGRGYEPNVWKFYADWASLSPVNKMQYQKLLAELEKYGNTVAGILQQHLEIKDKKQLEAIKYLVVDTILSDLWINYDYEPSKVDIGDFIKNIQNGNVSDLELSKNLSHQYENKRTYWEGWIVEPPLFHSLTNEDLLQKMIAAGYDVNVKNWYSKTPLMTAAHLNNLPAAKLLLVAGADPNLTMGKEQPIINAPGFIWGNPGDARAIIRQERTALMYACENANYEMVKLLIDNKADINAKDSEGNGMEFYLELNQNISEKEKQKIRELLK